MGWFSAWRDGGGPTLYGPEKTAVTADVLEAGFLYAICIVLFSLLIVIPGYRGQKKITYAIKICLAIFITGSLMLCNFGQEWEVGELTTRTQYRAGTKTEIDAHIEVKIGLRSVNITLKTNPENIQLDETTTERINYNERFSWNDLGWVQGRAGFGPYAGLVNREYRAAQIKGLPYPILWIAEYFTIDGEGIRWGRFYRQAGYYTHIMVWLAFPLWLLSMFLFNVLVHYGAYFSMLTGASLLMGNILYASICNPNELKILFDEEYLTFSWGWSFWLNMFNGLLCFGIGFAVWLLDLRYREAIDTFFGIDVFQDIEEYYASREELERLGIEVPVDDDQLQSEHEYNNNADDDEDNSVYDNPLKYQRMFRRKREGTLTWRYLGQKSQPSIRDAWRGSRKRGVVNSGFENGAPTPAMRYPNAMDYRISYSPELNNHKGSRRSISLESTIPNTPEVIYGDILQGLPNGGGAFDPVNPFPTKLPLRGNTGSNSKLYTSGRSINALKSNLSLSKAKHKHRRKTAKNSPYASNSSSIAGYIPQSWAPETPYDRALPIGQSLPTVYDYMPDTFSSGVSQSDPHLNLIDSYQRQLPTQKKKRKKKKVPTATLR